MSAIDNLTDAIFLADFPQIQNDTNSSTSTNNVSEESTDQSRHGSTLKSRPQNDVSETKDRGAENSITSRSDMNEADSVLDLDSIKKELRRQRWRESNKRLRSVYLAHPESGKIRQKRLKDQRERTSLAYKKLTESEKVEARRKHQVYKAQRLKNETNYQRFWRLIKGRQFRKNGYHNTAILLRYDTSLGMYGFSKPTFPNCSSPDDQFVETQIYRFNYILKKVLSGSPIPEKLFQTFEERGIDLPKHFFEHFVKDHDQE